MSALQPTEDVHIRRCSACILSDYSNEGSRNCRKICKTAFYKTPRHKSEALQLSGRINCAGKHAEEEIETVTKYKIGMEDVK